MDCILRGNRLASPMTDHRPSANNQSAIGTMTKTKTTRWRLQTSRPSLAFAQFHSPPCRRPFVLLARSLCGGQRWLPLSLSRRRQAARNPRGAMLPNSRKPLFLLCLHRMPKSQLLPLACSQMKRETFITCSPNVNCGNPR
jgi:hypothetical protein